MPAQEIERLATRLAQRGLAARIEVDGGIGPTNAARVVAAGASALVAGTAVFGEKDYAAAIARLRAAGESARAV